ncbi:YihY/virulence factor BrkB family protein [Streptomyces harbinensis]|uniref:YihY/virulence factor BrkB family protein n=1 Tax=Streptomyces harbinensis TaxID=1176198 RepID=UPI0015904DD9|nr:YihY/virulence factor BrkB family protein [Streptomyces harbinensis]QKV67943.1 YihY/virulence factor BrkB family protein [Streptomyces harbinensis]
MRGTRGGRNVHRRRPPEDWGTALRRTPVSLWRDDIDHWAAALTYYTVLAIFPGLLVALSVMSLTFPGAAPELIGHVTALVPANSRGDVHRALLDLADQRQAAWLLIVVATVSSVVSAYNYLSVFRRVQHAMHGVEDHRPAWRHIHRTLLTALGLLGLLIVSATALILTGGAVRTLGRALGTGEAVAAGWSALKWPLLMVLVAGLVLILFRTGPPAGRAPGRGAAGGALAVVLWLGASAGFALYASHVSTYNRLYGPLAGVIVFLVWLWLTNLSLLAGAQFNAELAKLRRPGGTERDGSGPGAAASAPTAAGPAGPAGPAPAGQPAAPPARLPPAAVPPGLPSAAVPPCPSPAAVPPGPPPAVPPRAVPPRPAAPGDAARLAPTPRPPA